MTQLIVPVMMWRALERQAPALARALRQDLAGRGIAIVTAPGGPVAAADLPQRQITSPQGPPAA